MQADSTVDEIVKEVNRFRILCAGRAGVGKSSVINRIFGLEQEVEHWNPGKADIERGLTSPENQFFVLHDSMGFGAGESDVFDIVSDFVNRRRDKNLPLKERLHAVWLCTEIPTAGGRVFESGDEKLVRLAHETETPVVVVFTKYDRLVRSKQIELNSDQPEHSVSDDLIQRSNVEAQKVLDNCMESLKRAETRLRTQKLNYAKFSIKPGYKDDVSFLIEITRDVVREKLKFDASAIWVIAQRANLPLKIDACINAGTGHYRRFLEGVPQSQVLLLHWLAEIHQDLLAWWNFKDGTNILSNDEFKQLMQYLVQDVQESLDHGDSYTSSPAIGKISQFLTRITSSSTILTPLETTSFADWLKGTAVHNAPKVRLLLTTYIVDLTTVLKSLFEITLERTQSPGEITWWELKGAFERYENSGSRQRIHSNIYTLFRKEQQVLDPDSFRGMFTELVKGGRQDARGLAPGTVPTTHTYPPVAPQEPPSGSSWWQRIPCLRPCL